MAVLELDGAVFVELLTTLLETLTEPGFKLEIPLFTKLVGRRGWINFNQTVVYIPGVPSAARLPGSRLPHCAESVQQAEFVPQNGPAAQAVQPIYTSFAAM